MRILHFLKKEMLHLVQAPEAVFMMILFPIALTWVLGMAFNNITTNIDLPELEVPVVEANSPYAEVFVKQGAQAGITFQPVTEEKAKADFELGETANYVTLGTKGITLQTARQASLEHAMVKMYSQAFVNQANLFQHAATSGRYDVFEELSKNYVSVTGLDAKKAPGSFDYYGVTMLTLIMLYGSQQASSLFGLERANKTESRLRVSPVPIMQLFFVKIAASLIVLAVQASIIVIVNSVFFKVDYGNLWTLALLLLFYGVFSSSLGVMVDQLTIKRESSDAVLQILTIAMLATGGAYFIVTENSGFFYTLQQFSPVGWINLAIFRTIYQGDVALILPTILRFIVVSVGMLAVAAWVYPKKGHEHASYR